MVGPSDLEVQRLDGIGLGRQSQFKTCYVIERLVEKTLNPVVMDPVGHLQAIAFQLGRRNLSFGAKPLSGD